MMTPLHKLIQQVASGKSHIQVGNTPSTRFWRRIAAWRKTTLAGKSWS